MQVSYIVSNINMALVQDRNPYDLHNTDEIIIMQMREKRECFSKQGRKEDLMETMLDPEITKT